MSETQEQETAPAEAIRTRFAGKTVALVVEGTPSPAVLSLRTRLESLGIVAPVLHADATLAAQVRRTCPVLCVPLAPARVTALLSALGVACAGAPPAALARLCDRTACLSALRDAGVSAPACTEFTVECSASSVEAAGLHFPVLVHRTPRFDAAPLVFPEGLAQNVDEITTVLKRESDDSKDAVVLVEEALSSAKMHTVTVVGGRVVRQPTPPLTPSTLAARVCEVAVAAATCLGLKDYARVTIAVRAADAGDSNPDAVPLHVVAADARLPLSTDDCHDDDEELMLQIILEALTRNKLEQGKQQQQKGEEKDDLRKAIEEDDVDRVISASESAAKVTGGATESYKQSEVPEELWNDWRWQLRHRLRTAEQLRRVLPLTAEEEAAFAGGAPRFPVAVTPYFASLIDAADPRDPIRLQVLPRAAEAQRHDEDIEDSLGEDAHMPVPGLVHRYPDRVLMLVSMACASYCRFCTRNRVVGGSRASGCNRKDNQGQDQHEQQQCQGGHHQQQQAKQRITRSYYETQLAYIRANPRIRDVLLSGGDPLLLPLGSLDWLLGALQRIPHVEVVRVGSRVPVVLPQRVTPALCAVLAAHHPVWLNTHVNHPRELAPACGAALARLAAAGVPLGAQTVLLAGVNDCPATMAALVHALVRHRVRPYYLYQCDLVVGAAHFRTPVATLLEIVEGLRGHTSGFCVPTAVIDAPHGGGKVPVSPAYLLAQNGVRTVVRNFEGFVSTYTGPRHYCAHDPTTCKYCAAAAQAAAAHPDPQEGVAGLLAGHANVIKPVGWDHAHLSRRNILQPHGTPDSSSSHLCCNNCCGHKDEGEDQHQ